MAAPPPPYTLEQINAMKSDEEKLRARAELTSYIVRMKREKEEREAKEASGNSAAPFGPHPNFMASPSRGGHRDQYTFAPRGSRFPTSYRGRSASRGRGNYGYHPYQRPPVHYGTYNHLNNPVNFGEGVEQLQSKGSSNSTSRASFDTHLEQNGVPQPNSTVCPAFTSSGVCSRASCPHIHDPTKQALCKPWFYKGSCSRGHFCHLSHKPTPNNTPTCDRFPIGQCFKTDCRFAHVALSPSALNCDAFGRLGFCEKGEQCREVHAHECPAYANTGTCFRGDKCLLRHVLYASRLRAAAQRSPLGSPSDTEESTEDDTKDALPELVITGRKDDTQNDNSISQQDDFIPLEG